MLSRLVVTTKFPRQYSTQVPLLTVLHVCYAGQRKRHYTAMYVRSIERDRSNLLERCRLRFDGDGRAGNENNPKAAIVAVIPFTGRLY